MQLKVALLMVAGGALSLTAMYGTVSYVQSMSVEVERLRSEAERIKEVITVPVVSRDVSRGAIISPGDFAALTVAASAVPSSILTDLEMLPGDASNSYVALSDIAANNFIFLSDLAVAPENEDVSDQVSLDGRRFAITPEDLPQLLQQVAVNERVDVYWTRKTSTSQLETRLLAVGLKVLELPDTGNSDPLEVAEKDTNLRSDSQVLLEGAADDVARILQARASAPTGEFRLVPARGDVNLGMRVISASEDSLAQLPLVRSNDATISEQLTANVTNALNSSFTPSTSQPTLCKLSIVRSATRSEVEVPC